MVLRAATAADARLPAAWRGEPHVAAGLDVDDGDTPPARVERPVA
jgi:hypothetical protein